MGRRFYVSSYLRIWEHVIVSSMGVQNTQDLFFARVDGLDGGRESSKMMIHVYLRRMWCSRGVLSARNTGSGLNIRRSAKLEYNVRTERCGYLCTSCVDTSKMRVLSHHLLVVCYAWTGGQTLCQTSQVETKRDEMFYFLNIF